MKKLILFETILIIFFVLAWNVSKADKVNLLGFGTQDCGAVVTAYDTDTMNELVYSSYITGVISGMLIESYTFTTFSSSAIIQETMNNCRNNPLKQFMKAIEETFLKIN